MSLGGTSELTARIGLGTVQLGMDYGVTNQSGQPELEEAKRIVGVAEDAGVPVIDTAASYGDSEEVVGQSLSRPSRMRIVTKTPSLPARGTDLGNIDVVREAFSRSLDRLSVTRVDGLLVHHAPDLLGEGGESLWGLLCDLRDRRLVEKIGVSVYEEEELSRILERYAVDLVQLPLNVLDQRWARPGQLDGLQQAGIEVHSRSAFLQGVLLQQPDDLPDQFRPLGRELQAYHDFRKEHGLTALQAALGFVLSTSVDCVIVGAARAEEFEAVLQAAASLPDEFPDFSSFACQDQQLINPRNWAA